MKQRSIREYTGSPLQDYNIVSTGWLGKSGNNSPKSTRIKTRSQKSRSEKLTKTPQKPITRDSPLGKWIKIDSQNVYNGKKTTKPDFEHMARNNSCRETDIAFAEVDDILKKIDMLNEEGKLLDQCDDILAEKDLSIFSPKRLSSEHSNKKSPQPKNMISSSTKSKCRNKNKVKKSAPHKPTNEVMSPLEKWIQQNCKKHVGKKPGKFKTKPFTKSDSFEKYGVILPTLDDILKNRNAMEEERKILADYDDLEDSFPSSLKSLLDSPGEISIPLLSCEHLSNSELKMYFVKYLDYLKNISEGVEFSERHQTYIDFKSRSKLTYSFSTIVFTETQLEYLMKKIEKELDPEDKRTEYLFMVILPELCLKICMDEFDMNKEETVDYLKQRPVD